MSIANGTAVPLSEVPFLAFPEFQERIVHACSGAGRLNGPPTGTVPLLAGRI